MSNSFLKGLILLAVDSSWLISLVGLSVVVDATTWFVWERKV